MSEIKLYGRNISNDFSISRDNRDLKLIPGFDGKRPIIPRK